MTEPTSPHKRAGDGGDLAVAVAVAQAHGVNMLFTLSGTHVFPMYDGVIKANPPTSGWATARSGPRATTGV